MTDAKKKRRERVFRRADGYEPSHFVESARDHMYSATVLFRSDYPGHFDSAGYLAQLSIELLLKAYLLGATGEFTAEHSVTRLIRLVKTSYPTVHPDRRLSKVLSKLDRFGELRYPRPADPIEIGNGDLQPVLDLFSKLWYALPEEYRPTHNPNGFVTKGGRILATLPDDFEGD